MARESLCRSTHSAFTVFFYISLLLLRSERHSVSLVMRDRPRSEWIINPEWLWRARDGETVSNWQCQRRRPTVLMHERRQKKREIYILRQWILYTLGLSEGEKEAENTIIVTTEINDFHLKAKIFGLCSMFDSPLPESIFTLFYFE